MLLSIIIPTYNRSSYLKQALAVLKNCLPDMHECDIHIIDDCSESPQRETNKSICNDYGAYCHLNTLNKGPAFSRNVGIDHAKGEWIAFLDDDVYIDEKWYANLRNALLNLNRDENVLGIEGVTKALGSGLWDNEVENLNGGMYLSSNIIYRKEVLLRLGGFDEAFTGPFAEDQELALRIKKWGDITFGKDIIVYHMPRRIKLLEYFSGSFSRMHSLLDAEYHFFMKHRDRYHTCRYAHTFWEGLMQILFKHVVSTLKRRKLLKLLLHPVQGFLLILSSLYEQFAAWVLSFRYIKKYISDNSDYHPVNINNKATAALWKFRNEKSSLILNLRPSIIRSIFFRIKRKPVYTALPLLKKAGKLTHSRNPRIFFRIDDLFLSDNELIEQLCDVMEQVKVPFLAGITGRDFTHGEYYQLINRINKAGGAIGIHGFTHNGTYGPYASEILQLNYPELDERIRAMMKTPVYKEIKPVAFIPPFNAISWEQIVYLSSSFSVICGGPETARFTNYSFGPVSLDTGAIYFPSYYPFYNSCANMLNSELIRSIIKSKAPICITAHLHNEAEDSFESLHKLANVLKSAITDWYSLCTISQNSNIQKKEMLI
jgi:glycosyltransferase involved in cell wall biosynthesis